MRHLIHSLSFISLLFLTPVYAQKIGLKDLEASFLKNNSQLLLQKQEISRAEALRIQEKVWPNPQLEISEVNLWTNKTVEPGIKQQYAIELQQRIETAGKRHKRLALKELEKQEAILQYELTLRELKKDLRQYYYAAYQGQAQLAQADSLLAVYDTVIPAYKAFTQKQQVAKADYIRLQAAHMKQKQERLAIVQELEANLYQLRVYSMQPELQVHQLAFNDLPALQEASASQSLQKAAYAETLVGKMQANKLEQAKANWTIERAKRIPDMHAILGNDRGGNIMRNFVGIGLAMDIPVFDKNKGAIKAAQIQIQQQEALLPALGFQHEQQISMLEKHLDLDRAALKEWESLLMEDQSALLAIYKKNLLARQITLLQFMDYMESFQDNYSAYLTLQNRYFQHTEELHFLLAQDLTDDE